MNFLQTMIEKAKKNKKTIVLPESYDIRVLKAASEVLRQEIANVILIGSEEEIKKAAGDLDISKARIIKPEAFERFDEYADSFFEMRKKKGITVEEARETMKDPLYFGVMLVKMNEADGMVAGAVNSTPITPAY
jgi:phosphate acetyltransferase